MKPPSKPIALLVLFSLVTGALYFRTIAFDFVTYDDGVYVTANGQVRAGLTWAGVVHAFTTGETGTWQPLTLLSHMLDCELFGLNAGGHHATSAVFHAVNTLLLGLALLRMTGAAGPSLFTAAVFGLHPLHVESVAWVAERKDVLSTLFFMATLYAYALWAETLRKRWLAAATAVMALGLMAKPMLVTLPCVLLLLDYWPLRRVHTENRLRCFALLAAEKLPMFVLAAAASVATIVVQRGAQATSSFETLPIILRVENAVTAYVRYIGKTLWPSDLLIFYPHPLDSLSVFFVVASTLVLLGITVAAWTQRRRAPYLIVGWLWYVVTLLPVIGIIQVGTQAMAERYSYIPMIGISLMASWAARDAFAGFDSRALRRALPLAASAILTVLAVLTWNRMGVWRDSETLYRNTVRAMPDNPVGNMGLGLLLVDAKRYAEAIPFLEMSVRKRHREPEAQYHLGIAHQELRNFEKAEEHYRAAVALDPGYSLAWNNLGVTLDALGKKTESLAAFERAVQTGPGNQEAAVNLVRYLIQLGRIDDARACAAEAHARMPASDELNMVIAYLESLNSRAPAP
ncbi:MAG: tetratricopeptide repeat protein [Candidatus Hydrogenedentes bacterium]|nr:tetratricopeptide repeat protein [Candidatus Hydrogenedentota bacterium]